MTARHILAVCWVGVVLYAYPGYMSYDSVLQLLQARDGVYTGAHPPVMGVLWGLVDSLFAGPAAMLLLQVTCFVAGAYLLLRRCMSDRAAACCTLVMTWLPPVSAVLGVIWKDSQMAAFLVLGTALLVEDRRRTRLAGLLLFFLATAMRYNALALTLPLVVLLFHWQPRARWYTRYAIALIAWLAITVGANVINKALATEIERKYPWHDIAMFDIAGTLRYAPDLADDDLRDVFAGTPLIVARDFQDVARRDHSPDDLSAFQVSTFGSGRYVPALWVTTFHLFRTPATAAERDAIVKARRRLLVAHPVAYLAHRWQVTQERIGLGSEPIPSAYVWFTEVLDIAGSAKRIEHNARPSKLQAKLQAAMVWLGTSFLFRPWLYLAILLAVIAFVRDRTTLALALSGLANEVTLFVIAPTVDYRYSVWLVVSTLLVVLRLVGLRAGSTSPEVSFRHIETETSPSP